MSLREWKPTARQEDFLSLPDNIFEGLYGGAAGGGKTETLLMLPLVKQDKKNKPLYEHPRFKMLFLRRTYPELDSEVIPRSKDFFPSTGANPYQDQKKRWTWPSGAIVQFGHCEHEKDVAKYDTSEYNIIAFDEATSFTPYQYEYLTFSRCRTSSPDLPAIVRGGTNPGNIGHSYFRKRFVEPSRNGNCILRETRTVRGVSQTLLRIFIPSKATDNTYLIAADPDYVNRLNRLPEAERAAKADGDWWTFSGQVFDDWRTQPFPDEPSHAQHIVPSFRIPDYWPKVLSMDWGFSAMTIAGWYAINPCPSDRYPATIYKYREYSCKKTKISTWASDIRRLSGNEQFMDIVLDPSAWASRGEPATIAEQFEQHSGFSPRRADNDRVSGKLLLQDLIRWKSRPPRFVPQEGFDAELAMELNRKRGPQAYAEYTALFKPEPEEKFLPKFQIFADCCPETEKVIPVCVYDKDNKEDVAEFDGDDPYDETRYGIKACQYYLETGKSQYQVEAQRSAICTALEESSATPSSMTSFYIKMGNLDAQVAHANRPMKRFHGRGLRGANFR